MDIFTPPLLDDLEGQAFVAFEKHEDVESGRVFFHGDLVSQLNHFKSVCSVNAKDRKGKIGGGVNIETEIIQLSEWQYPPFQALPAVDVRDFEQFYLRHVFFDHEGTKLSPELAISRFPQAGATSLFPVRRSGYWYQDSFKRQLSLWFRLRDVDGIPPNENTLKVVDTIDHRTGFRMGSTSLTRMGKREYRLRVATPFWHSGGMDFVLDQRPSLDSNNNFFDLVEGEIIEIDGIHIQILFLRPGEWRFCSLNEQEAEIAKDSVYSKAISKRAEGNATLVAVTDADPEIWRMGIVGVDGEAKSRLVSSGPFLMGNFVTIPRQKEHVEPCQLFVNRKIDRHRIIVSVDAIGQTTAENKNPEDLFDQRLPFFYAATYSDAMKALSHLVAIEWEHPRISFPRKPEGFPLILHDVTGHEIANAIMLSMEKEGIKLELNRESWRWEFHKIAESTPTKAQN